MMTSLESAAYPLSHGQRAVWVQQRLAPQSTAHTLSCALRVRGDLDVAALRRAFQALIDRHAVLRTTFTELSGDPTQQIHARVTAPFVQEDASGWSEAAMSARLDAEASRSFDLEQGPLTRLHLFTRAAGAQIMLLTLHEIVADARSLQILLPELDTLYRAETAGVPAPLAARQCTDDVRRRNEALAGPEGERLWSYWQRQLAGAPLTLDLPTSTPRTAVRTQGGASYTLALGAALTAALKTLARHEGVTLDTLLLAAFQALLSRYTGQEDIVVGALVAGDDEDEDPFADVVGYHADPLPLRVDLAGDPPFTELLRRVCETARDARAHRDYPFALLVERLRPARVPGYAPLAQVLFEWRQARPHAMGDLTPLLLGVSGAPLRFGDLTLEPLVLDRGATPLDLTLRMGEVAGEIVASFAYNTDLFDAPLIARLAGHLQVLLAGVGADPARRLSALPLLTPVEREQLLVEWNGAVVPYPRDKCVHQLIEEQTALTPDAVAVEYGHERLTYRELDERANRLAHYLQKAGVGPEALVCVCLEPSPELFVAQIGVLKAGGGYVPLDPAFPQERMAFMLADTQAPVLVTQRSLRERVPSSYAGRIVCMDAEAAVIAREPTQPVVSGVTPDNTAAVTYTSGSTGRPKGALRSHRMALDVLKTDISCDCVKFRRRVS
ncbi:MAG: condensation domain-containing protein, partial [Chloroflexota bacterium]|nr:condensation domain-containing protein [Chloroflexota bacterium]